MHNPDTDNSKSGRISPQNRDSNIELLRILAMLTIIAHHYVVNSTVTQLFDYSHVTPQQYFLEIWGMWGKTAINSFVLISGYFLCQMKLTWQKYFKLIFKCLFYGIAIMLIFAICGYHRLTVKIVVKQIFGLFTNINNDFVASFMTFYAFVPIYNIVIKNIDKRQFRWLVGGLLFVFSITATFFNSSSMNEPAWYMTLYFVGAYVKTHPSKHLNSSRLWWWILIASVVIAIASVFAIINFAPYLSKFTGLDMAYTRYYFVHDSNKLLAFAVGFSAFMVAKNLKPFYNKYINFISAGTFGVLLIHASSDTMQQWLWIDTVGVPNMINASMPALILHALITPLVIFAVCMFIDYFYRSYIERPVMKAITKKAKS